MKNTSLLVLLGNAKRTRVIGVKPLKTENVVFAPSASG
nr:MAG TPA: hypothetical protein [Microviridae sp.]